MCFSTGASFGASAVLTVIGVASIKQVQHRSQIVFACIPLFFAAQQFAEGMVWLSFGTPFNAVLNLYSTYIFLIFAQVVWPLWIPIAMVMVENKGERRKIQRVFVAMGVTEAIYQAWSLLIYPVHSQVTGHHIYYEIVRPDSCIKYIEPFFYVSATIISPFFTTIKRMWIVGAAILISCLITLLFFHHVSVSVWCFFASIISISVFLIMRQIKKSGVHLAPL